MRCIRYKIWKIGIGNTCGRQALQIICINLPTDLIPILVKANTLTTVQLITTKEFTPKIAIALIRVIPRGSILPRNVTSIFIIATVLIDLRVVSNVISRAIFVNNVTTCIIIISTRRRARSILNARALPYPAITVDVAATKPVPVSAVKVITLAGLYLVIVPRLKPRIVVEVHHAQQRITTIAIRNVQL